MDKQPTMILLTREGGMVGSCVHYPHKDGWQFIPAVTSRKTSRRYWPTANKCIPRWAFDLSDEMLTSDEFKARRRGR